MNPDLREKYKPLKIGLQIFPQLIRLSENPLCKYQVAPDMVMTVGMTMVLPSSHSLKQWGRLCQNDSWGETPVRW